MALRIVIADNTFCSGCGNAVEARAGLCFTCGQPFEGETTGTKCPQCGRAVEQAQSQCPACGTEFPRAAEPEVHAQASAPEPPPPPEDKNLLAEIKSFRDQGRADLDRLADIPTAPPTEATDQSLL
ncbi:MAG TPA: zinc ribbon domain-containing protein, partial [Thermoplasmata archaeon]|nr:zinc ribbon domain-containing protein [Thermoplasmata archaeon]